ncbi:MAG: hypothetical protein JJE18_04980 [Eubacteriaceae bacterium]|nr:hypothetical protein [Eubacteriaceae bacterium]
MKLTVLGNTGPFPAPGGACSGYLFESNGSRIILDFGSGVMANLQKYQSVSDKEACEIANEAGVKTLILAHLDPFGDPEAYLSKGKKLFHGALYVSEIGKSFDIKALSKN